MTTFIIPLYRAGNLISPLLNALTVLRTKSSKPAQFILVFDGPDEECREQVVELAKNLDFSLKVVTLTRHTGVAGALFAGLASTSQDEAAVCFGADLQEPLDTLVQLASQVENGADIVLGQRISRNDGLISDFFSKTYWVLARHFIDASIPKGGFDVFALSPRARMSLLRMPGARPNITTQLFRLGYDINFVHFNRIPRQIGSSSWSLRRKISLALDSLFVTNVSGTAKLLALLLAFYFFIAVGLASALTLTFVLSPLQKVILISTILGLSLPLFAILCFGCYQISVLIDETYRASKFEISDVQHTEGGQ